MLQIKKNDNIVPKLKFQDNYFSFYINDVTEKEDFLNLEIFILNISDYSNSEDEIVEKIKSFLNISDIKWLDKIDLFHECENLILYHGTTKESFQGKNSYIYLTTSLSHAIFHANDRALS